ncbi:hypothetical protein GPL21_37360 [Bradyrhizobium pachyrhizi]|uniref:Uncharacterized protein n=1 Tax=Bradyrhizobium pachyrhizi TaxID=280333 RepID=A0A844SUL0_9BRAD|nr:MULTISPECIES: hypothetical protein [Bradyrhizobium]MVT70733.1 hypothetical protein [Bradyrhizobium pachyrhizi]
MTLPEGSQLRCGESKEVTTRSSRDELNAKLVAEAIAVLRELVSRARDAADESYDDGHSVDTWKSEDFRAAIECAEAVIAKAASAMAGPRTE